MKRPIAISLSPNMEKDDVWLAVKMLFSPINWFNFRKTEKLEKEFAKRFGKNYKAVAMNSGRGALYLILKTLGIKRGDEVILQALTCVVVANSIRWAGARPVYVDVDRSYNLDPEKLSEKISERTKAIIVQHSFGTPANMKLIKKIARKHKITLIEDCAISLGAKYSGKQVGTIGDISFFSFGRDKVISSVFGGMILTKNVKLYEALKSGKDSLNYPSPFWVIQQLLHPILFFLILPLYNIGFGKLTIGKVLLFGFQKLKTLSMPVCKDEKRGITLKAFPLKMPGALAVLALNQFKKLDEFNKHRKLIARKYFKMLSKTNFILPPKNKGSIWHRFPILHNNAKRIFNLAKKNKILLGDWYRKPVVPVGSIYSAGYEKGSCPKAEKYSRELINLPTYPTLNFEQAEEVVRVIKDG